MEKYEEQLEEEELLDSGNNNLLSSKSIDQILKEHNSLKQGDLVIHREYGLGRFMGMETIEIDGVKNDLLRIEYADRASLLIPVENCDLLSKYDSFDGREKLDSLGSSSWSERKASIRKKIKDMAKKLMELAAIRKLKKAQIFKANAGEYEEFCSNFEFEPTVDQLKAVEDIRNDLTSGMPMDRLLCGDVGYGKTEVAMRAAFIVTNNLEKAQVAVITPTTLLCRQHYDKFRERFRNTAVTIASISSANTPAEIRQLEERLETGEIDIIIGTHSLFSEKIKFKNLGLIIVDEEQKFGVSQKEKLKELRLNSHILSMSATPIPRTLQMSLAGIRELSLLTTAPQDRNNVKTTVCSYDDAFIKKVIEREIERDGLIFFVVPRIKDLREVEARLKSTIPNLSYALVHGRTNSEKSNEIMEKFYDGKFRVLLTTTIMENGIDIPRANTIIVYRANNFGLAQLYQLRGRVGRNKTQSYAYLTTKPTEKLTEEAKKRLDIIGSIDELGAGFSIASHDMKLRGAGNLLGEAQVGHIKEIGLELYNQLLKQALDYYAANPLGSDSDGNKNNEGDSGGKDNNAGDDGGGNPLEDMEENDDFSPEIRLDIPTLIPDDYISNPHIKIKYYRLLASIANDREARALEEELKREYGDIPESLKNLFQLAQIRLVCRELNIEKIVCRNDGKIKVNFYKNKFASPDNLLKYVLSHPSVVKFRGDDLLFFANKNNKTLDNVKNILEILGRV